MRIHFIRHTRPLVDAGICYGQADIPLAPSYLHDRTQLSQKLLKHYDVVYSSPLTRCQVLAKSLGHRNIILDERLLEYNFGDWELQAWAELTSEHAQKWFDDYVTNSPPNGETLIAMNQRVTTFIEEIFDNNELSKSDIAVVTHAGVIRLLANYILNGELKMTPNLKLEYGAIVELIKFNDRNHSTIQFI